MKVWKKEEADKITKNQDTWTWTADTRRSEIRCSIDTQVGQSRPKMASNDRLTASMRRKNMLRRSKTSEDPMQSDHVDSRNVPSNRFLSQSLTDLLTCPICLEQLRRPTMLPCQHTYGFIPRFFSCYFNQFFSPFFTESGLSPFLFPHG